ncbi:MAG: hypothetical protein O3C57_01980 [Verrucomicrobia bacterium]|nr:hypothetical protein [Verrucomicrobiota bacterium]
MLTVAGCGDRSSDATIKSVRHESKPFADAVPATSAQRFGYNRPQAGGSGSGPAQAGDDMGSPALDPAEAPLHWTAPATWIQGPARTMRLVTYFLDEAQSAECYVTILPGSAGGDAANLNRWCGQMGHAALDDAGLAALPRILCLGQQAPLLKLEGTFTGMGTSEQPNSLFAGTVVQSVGKTVFVKMVGPKSIVESQLDAFNAFCASLHEAGSHAQGDSHE